MKISKYLLAAASLAFVTGTASANVTFSYQGNQLISNGEFGNTGLTYAPISMIFEFSDDGSSLIDWSISQSDTGTLTKADADLQQANGLIFAQLFRLDTDSSGNVTDWGFSVLKLLEENTSSNAHSVYFNSHSDLLKIGSNANDSFSLYNFGPTPDLMAFSRTQGTWNVSSILPDFHFNETLNYESPSPVPEPSTYLMLLAGLGLLGGTRYKTNVQNRN